MTPTTRSADAVTAVSTPETSDTTRLTRLYAARAAFALVWAGLLAVTASDLDPAGVALLALYPLVDLAAAAYDLRSPGGHRQRSALRLTMALSLLATIGLAVAATSGIPDVLCVWGAWAITAGIVQLVVAVQRRRLGGQVALVLSGGISTLAGAGFIAMAAGSDASLTGLAGYAALGGIFFLASAVRLRRVAAA